MTINTKKSFKELVDFLESSKNKKVSTILPMIYEMTNSKVQTSTSFSVDDKVVAIYCYYHKAWELLSEADYGLKASSSTGFNTMCKVGVNLWTKQNRMVKQVGNTIIDMLESGELKADDLSDKKEELLTEAKKLDDANRPDSFETLEDLKAHLAKASPKANASPE